jgi:hypothetical protein
VGILLPSVLFVFIRKRIHILPIPISPLRIHHLSPYDNRSIPSYSMHPTFLLNPALRVFHCIFNPTDIDNLKILN